MTVTEGVTCIASVQVRRLRLRHLRVVHLPELTESSWNEEAAAACSFSMSYMLENAASQGMSIEIQRHDHSRRENKF